MHQFEARSALLAGGLVLAAASALAAGNFPQPSGICDRTCWTARAPQCTMSVESTFTRAIIHYSAVASDYNSTGLEDSKADVRGHQNYHMDSNGWCDIGYHFLVDRYGNKFEGRYNSMTQYTRGAHDSVNNQSMGVCTMGSWHSGGDPEPPQVMREAVYDLIAWRVPDPYTALGSSTNYASGKTVGFLDGHRAVISTSCPGDKLYNPYIGTNYSGGEARLAVNQRIGGGGGGGATEMSVASVVPSTVKSGNKKKGRVVVTILDDLGGAVSGATVTGAFTGSYNQTLSGTTASNGTVTLTTTAAVAGTVAFQFCVTDVTGGTLSYVPASNVETCDGL